MAFAFLTVPEDGPNLILTFHCYYPMFLTHYRATWVKECAAYDGPLCYPGMVVPQEAFDRLAPETQRLIAKWVKHGDRSVMAADLLWPLAVAARTRLPLYGGEFGVIAAAPANPNEAWHRDFIAVLEERGIAWANWSYKGGFGMLDREGRPPSYLDAILAK
jgi:endoglucanase